MELKAELNGQPLPQRNQGGGNANNAIQPQQQQNAGNNAGGGPQVDNKNKQNFVPKGRNQRGGRGFNRQGGPNNIGGNVNNGNNGNNAINTTNASNASNANNNANNQRGGNFPRRNQNEQNNEGGNVENVNARQTSAGPATGNNRPGAGPVAGNNRQSGAGPAGNNDRNNQHDRNDRNNLHDRNDRNNLHDRNDRERKGERGIRKSEDFMIQQKLKQLQGPTHELPSIEHEEIKFSGRNRLYIGNLTNDVTEEELRALFKPFGEIGEAFINTEKNFAFIKVDYHANAEKAKRELDGHMRKNRPLRVRFAPNATTIRVKNLTSHVTNELLHKSFEIFGPIERAVIIVDDRGKPTGEGIVEYTRKSGAMAAIRYCNEKCFFLTSSLRPCVCELFEHIDDTDGYPEKALNKKNQDVYKARQTGPRFAETSSFQHEYGTRWKQLHELYKQKHEALKREQIMEEEKLEAQMEYARYEHETEMLREQLRAREMDRDQRKTEWERKERFVEEQRTQSEEQLRRTQDEMAVRMNRQEEELRRRQQENNLFMQAQQLMLDAQEINQVAGGGNLGNNIDLERNNRGDNRGFNNNMGGRGGFNNQDSGFIDYDHGGMNNRGGARFNDERGNQNQGNNHHNHQQGGNRGPRGNNQWNDHRDMAGFQNKRRRF